MGWTERVDSMLQARGRRAIKCTGLTALFVAVAIDSAAVVLLREAACSSRRPLSYARFRAFVEEELSPQDFGVGQGDRLCVVLPNGAAAHA